MSVPPYAADAMDVDHVANINQVNSSTSRARIPVQFSGDNDILTLPNFITVVRLHIMTRQISDEPTKIALFGQQLTGSAAKWFFAWFENHIDTDVTFIDFLRQFQDHYSRQLDPYKLLNAFQSLTQDNMSIETYNNKFRELWTLMPDGYWTEKGAMLAYVRGLRGPASTLVPLGSPSTLEEAYNIAYSTTSVGKRHLMENTTPTMDHDGDVIMTGAAIQHDRPGRRGRGRNGYDNNRHSNQRPAARNSDRPSRTEHIQQRLCFKCHKAGHMARDCRSRESNPSPRY